MSASGQIHGAQLASPRWWRPFRNVPLVLLAVLSLVAAVVGWVTQARLDVEGAAPAAVTEPAGEDAAGADPVAAACRAPLPAPEDEPWLAGDGAAEEQWQQHADELSGAVVTGRDGWAFYNDQVEQNFSQAVGRRLLTSAEVDAWVDYFAALDEGLRERGIDLLIAVTPSATSVYPEQLPAWTDGLTGSTPLDQLLVAAGDLPFVDFRADLRAAAADAAVYTPVNSHWTDWGGYVGWQTLAACHDVRYPDAEPFVVPMTTDVAETVEYNEYTAFGVPDTGEAWTVPVYAQQPATARVTDAAGVVTEVTGETPLDLGALPASTATADAASDASALILRDSMGNALSPLWQQQFAETVQIQHRYDDWSSPPNYRVLVEEHDPDVVIVQLAERHLVNAPALPSGF